MAERLQKVLAAAGIASRRKAEVLIQQGHVTVNGVKAQLGMKVSAQDVIKVHGQELSRSRETVTFMLNKPRGVLSTVYDDRGRPTVMSYVPKMPGLHPVGRLDKESEGLLLLSNDGDLTMRLTHPRFAHEKEYRVWCKEGSLSRRDIASLEEGLKLEDGFAKAVHAKVAKGGCWIVLSEGRNRQVRRMLAALGYHVSRLKRTRIAQLQLGHLKPGEFQSLHAKDLGKLQ